MTGSLDTSKRFFNINKPVFVALLDVVQQRAAKYIKDTRPPVDDAFNTAGNQIVSTALDFLFNNPVLNFIMRYNPISILLEAAWDALDDTIKVPSMKSLEDIWQRILPKLAKDEFSIIIQLVDDIMIKVKAFLNGDISLSGLFLNLLGDTFWTVFDALKAIILAAIDMVPDLIGAFEELITGVWKFPLITSLWEDFTGEEFTLLKFVTFLVAQGMNLYYLIKQDELPFPEGTNGAAYVNYADHELDMSFLLPGHSRASQRRPDRTQTKGVSSVHGIKDMKISREQTIRSIRDTGNPVSKQSPIHSDVPKHPYQPPTVVQKIQKRQRDIRPHRPHHQHVLHRRRRCDRPSRMARRHWSRPTLHRSIATVGSAAQGRDEDGRHCGKVSDRVAGCPTRGGLFHVLAPLGPIDLFDHRLSQR